MYKGGTAQDKERVDSLKRYTVKADGGNESTVHAGTRGDKTNLANFALRFLTAVPGSEAWDSITRTDMANFAALVMGLPIPSSTGMPLPTLCNCGQPLDPYGHHRLTCPSWMALRAKTKIAHDRMLLGLADSFRSCDVACTMDLTQVPPHQHCCRQGDMFFPDQLLAKSNLPIVADLSICHPFSGD